jgi:hypothetical protein
MQSDGTHGGKSPSTSKRSVADADDLVAEVLKADRESRANDAVPPFKVPPVPAISNENSATSTEEEM